MENANMDFQKVSCESVKKNPFMSQQTYLFIRATDILKFYKVLCCTFCKDLFCL